MNGEIGSDFCSAECRKNDKKYFISGRTALDYVIKDIRKSNRVHSALLPSYCCHTMIEPFIKNGISVRFYDVFPDQESGIRISIPELREEIFYDMGYFGYKDLKGYDRQYIRKNWRIIIEDKTHSWLSSDRFAVSDYRYISYRKWTGVDGGVALAEKRNGKFQIECQNKTNEEYYKLITSAVIMKEQYFAGIINQKDRYLSLFHQAEELLEKDYVGYRPSLDSLEKLLNLDIEFIKKKRKQNAEILIDGLWGITEIKLLFPDIKEGDVPLFVPILIGKERDALRRYLISHNVYCPVHWPVSEYHSGISKRALEIYWQELSLVCDQRYEIEDMERIVKLIQQYFA